MFLDVVRSRFCWAASLLLCIGVSTARAQDATWNGATSEWTTPGNWSPASVPTGTAIFTGSGATSISNAGGAVTLGEILFNANAQHYQIAVDNPFTLTGAGVVNNSGAIQFFGVSSSLTFQNSASASAGTTALSVGLGNGLYGVAYEGIGTITFNNSSTAGTAAILNGGSVNFNQTATAANSLIVTGEGGTVNFNNASSAGNSLIAVGAFGGGGTLNFNGTSSAGNAHIESVGTVSFGGASTAGNATIETFRGGTTFFSGASTGGTARLIADAGGIVDFSGVATFSFTVGSIEGAGTYSLGHKSFRVGSNNLSTTVSGVIEDGGARGYLNKIGTGTLTLTGANTYTGVTTVFGGTLEVDGSVASVAVTSGGTLSGTGAVGDTSSGGTLAPGNATNPTGALTIDGSLIFRSGFYRVQVGASASNTQVLGTATFLPGATQLVQVAVTNGAQANKSYDILHAAGGFAGTFTGVQSLTPGFAETLSYGANDVFLNLTANIGGGGGLNGNQHNAANGINNAFNSGAPLPAGFFNLFQLSGAPLAGVLTQASGETAIGAQQTTFGAMGQFMGVMTDPIMGRGGDVNGTPSAIGYAEESAYAARSNPTDAFAMFTKAPLAKVYEPRWSVWASGFGGAQSTSGNVAVGSNNTTSQMFGTAVGADYRISAYTLAGFALAGGGTNFSVAGSGTGRSDLFQAGAYLRRNQGPAYITAALAYGWQDITTNRTVTIAGFDQFRAEFNANAWSGRLEGGYRLVAPSTFGIGITPYAAAQFTTFHLPAYAEQAVAGSSAFALAYGAKSTTDARTELGIRTDKSFVVLDGILTLRSRFAWAHDYDPNRTIAATFQALPGASFVVNGAAQAFDSALTTASVEMKWRNGWSAAATFEGEFSNVTSSYAGKGAVRYQW